MPSSQLCEPLEGYPTSSLTIDLVASATKPLNGCHPASPFPNRISSQLRQPLGMISSSTLHNKTSSYLHTTWKGCPPAPSLQVQLKAPWKNILQPP